MKLRHFSFPLLASIILLAVTAASTNAEEIRHSFIGVGKANKTVIVGEDGKVEWRIDLPASDGWVLPNGNVLLALYGTKGFPNGGVVEIDRKTKKFLFQYKGGQKEVSTVVALSDDKFLVAELGPEPRAIVINRKGEILENTPLACQKKNAHMQTRMLRVLPNGNYIAPHLLDFAVKEYEPKTGKVLKSFPTDDRGRGKHDWPFTAIRLKNGNTLIGCTNGNRIIEIDGEGKIVWSVTNEDIGEKTLRRRLWRPTPAQRQYGGHQLSRKGRQREALRGDPRQESRLALLRHEGGIPPLPDPHHQRQASGRQHLEVGSGLCSDAHAYPD